MESTGRRTFVLVDGENIDATLGTSLLNRRPQPEERPRWERVTDYAAELGASRSPACSSSTPPAAAARHVRAGAAGDGLPARSPSAGDSDEKVVDVGIQRTLDALRGHPDADVLLCSHDARLRRGCRRAPGGRPPRRRRRAPRVHQHAATPPPTSSPRPGDDVGLQPSCRGCGSSRSTTSTPSGSCADPSGGSALRYDDLLARSAAPPRGAAPARRRAPTSGCGPSSRTATRPARSRTGRRWG